MVPCSTSYHICLWDHDHHFRHKTLLKNRTSFLWEDIFYPHANDFQVASILLTVCETQVAKVVPTKMVIQTHFPNGKAASWYTSSEFSKKSQSHHLHVKTRCSGDVDLTDKKDFAPIFWSVSLGMHASTSMSVAPTCTESASFHRSWIESHLYSNHT